MCKGMTTTATVEELPTVAQLAIGEEVEATMALASPEVAESKADAPETFPKDNKCKNAIGAKEPKVQ
jgi:hypothetical protein